MHTHLGVGLVLETVNLTDLGADAERVTRAMERLLRRLARGTLPLTSLADVALTHEGLSVAQRARLEAAAGRALAFVEVPPGTDYYAAKNAGFDALAAAGRADVVAFGDADCWPDDAWLAELVAPFAGDPTVAVVAGRTTYGDDDPLTAALTAIDFSMVPFREDPRRARHFFANSVAFRRDVFARYRYAPRADVHRGACGRVAFHLAADGVAIRFAPRAHTRHRAPQSVRELFARRCSRGADLAALAPEIADAYLPPPARVLGRLGAASALVLLGGRTLVSLGAVTHAPRHRLRTTLAVLGVTAIDAYGALARHAA